MTKTRLTAKNLTIGSPQLGSPKLSSYSPLQKRHPIYARIGKLVAEAARFEHLLDAIIWDLLDLPRERAACITAQLLGATPRFRAIIALCKQRHVQTKLVESAEEILRKSYDCVEYRNRTVHDPWYIEQETKRAAQWRSMPYKKLEFGIQDVDLTKIGETTRAYRRLSESTQRLHLEILKSLRSSLGK